MRRAALVLHGAALATLAAACNGDPDVVATQRRSPPLDAPMRPPEMLALSGDLDVHDPSIIEADAGYFIFHTGGGIQRKSSDDLLAWRSGPSVFAENPSWIAERVPNVTALWSPDIAFFGGQYHLYYAASTLGSNRSCIGHATTPVLTETSTFTDRGPLICSNVPPTPPDTEDWNAIDPGVVLDEQGAPFVVFGSYRSGIQLIPLDPDGTRSGDERVPVAARVRPEAEAIQAATLVRRDSDYFLFASFDFCCRGVMSTHYIVVGRSPDIRGPYLDRAGVPLLEGGGTILLESNERWAGPGSNSLLFRGERTYNAYHAHDVNGPGSSTLRIAEVVWDDEGWPVSAGP